MDRKIALSAAGALAMTTAAGVLAISMTVGQSTGSAPDPVLTTEYQVVQVNPDQSITTTTVAPTARTVYEIEYVEETTQSAMPAYEDDDHDEYEDHDESEHEEDDDD